MKRAVRTRFAPSPTGFLHVGGVRTALFNYLYAKKHGGQFLLRLEDTDRERHVPEGVEQIVEALDWLGLQPDEGFWISEGKHQNVEYIQSKRHEDDKYKNKAEQLISDGLAYYSPTTKDELESLRDKAKKDKKAFLYRKFLDSSNTSQETIGVPIRFDVEEYVKRRQQQSLIDFEEWDDLVMGHIHQKHQDIEDFILIKSDGFPTYNFANVIDDIDMDITDVLRGQEFVASTPKHLMLYKVLGVKDNELPKFAHLPVINGADGKKLSKRTGDTNTLDYRDKGYLPEALLNFLALLGWNDGTEQEIFSLKELEKKFSLERVNNSPAIFDPKRLDWMNGYYIRNLELSKLYDLVESGKYWPKNALGAAIYFKMEVLRLVQERLKYLSEIPDLTDFLFSEDYILEKDLLVKSASGIGEPKKVLGIVKKELEQSDFSSSDLEKRLFKLKDKLEIQPKDLFGLIRVSITGKKIAPGLWEMLHVLGKDKSLSRLNRALEIIPN